MKDSEADYFLCGEDLRCRLSEEKKTVSDVKYHKKKKKKKEKKKVFNSTKERWSRYRDYWCRNVKAYEKKKKKVIYSHLNFRLLLI